MDEINEQALFVVISDEDGECRTVQLESDTPLDVAETIRLILHDTEQAQGEPAGRTYFLGKPSYWWRQE